MKKQLGFIPALISYALLCLFPGILLIEDRSLLSFAPYYLTGMVPLVLITAITVSQSKAPTKSVLLKIILLLTLSVPFFILASYPFSTINILLVLTVICFGMSLPFWSVYLTWWFYTIGGSMPLPKDHNWMIGKKNYKGSGKAYRQFVEKSMGIIGGLGFAGLFLAKYVGTSGSLLFLQALSIVLLFGFSLTLGADFKKKTLNN